MITNLKGSCVCNTGYSTSDCSLKLSDSPLLFGTTYSNNTYDFANSSLSDVLLVVSKFVADSEAAVVKCTKLV